MGRRSVHTSDELRELILEASTDLVRESGYAGLSAREIARRIGYSPGTLYNIFENIDDLLLTIEGRLLDKLLSEFEAALEVSDPYQRVHTLTRRYLNFAEENSRLWGLMFEHNLPKEHSMPGWYQEKVEALLTRLEEALAPFADVRDKDGLRRSARVLWAGMHGLTAFSVGHKLAGGSGDTVSMLVDNFVSTYISGLTTAADQTTRASA